MSFKTLAKIRLPAILAFTVILTGCMSQKPDYLNMITAAELNRIMQHEDIFLVDVHTPKQAHIKGTDLFLPYNEIEKNQHKLPKDKIQPFICIAKADLWPIQRQSRCMDWATET